MTHSEGCKNAVCNLVATGLKYLCTRNQQKREKWYTNIITNIIMNIIMSVVHTNTIMNTREVKGSCY